MNTEALVSLGAYFLLMAGIGYYAYKKSTSDVSEYMLGGRQLSPAVASLSAGASDMSGWMLMGLPGAIFVSGLSEAWIAIGLMIGAYINYLLVAPRLRVYTELADDAITIPDFFEKRFKDKSRQLRVFSAVVIILFFTLYTSAGVVAGGKLFEASFGLDYRTGLFLTASVVVGYTLVGGFLAVSMTDFVQGVIMFIALVLVPIIAYMELDNLRAIAADVPKVDAEFLSLTSGIGIVSIISLMSWGLGYFGQPHIIVRFMAIRDLPGVRTARHIGMSWMLLTVLGAVGTGIIGLLYMTESAQSLGDPETVFIVLSQLLFHPYIGGFLLAAILAAIMSTISSQLLVASSSLTEDVYKTFVRPDATQTELVAIGRGAVFAVALVAILLAFDRSSNILNLVSHAWAGFGAAFGPAILLGLYWRKMTKEGALASMLVGSAVVIFWVYVPVLGNGDSLASLFYEMIPGFVASMVAAIIVSLRSSEPAQAIQDQYVEMEKMMDSDGTVTQPGE